MIDGRGRIGAASVGAALLAGTALVLGVMSLGRGDGRAPADAQAEVDAALPGGERTPGASVAGARAATPMGTLAGTSGTRRAPTAGTKAPTAARAPRAVPLSGTAPLASVPAEQLDPSALQDPAAHRAARRAALSAQAQADALALHAASGGAPLDPALLAKAREAALLASP